MTLTNSEILAWLREHDADRLAELWRQADTARRENVGDAVHLRGLLEISNYCDRHCLYCGLRVANEQIVRYRMTSQEILATAHEAVERGYGTIVLQSGEDPELDIDQFCQMIDTVKAQTPLAVTLSLGELGEDDLESLRRAGADRYLLRFETSNEALFHQIHPLKVGEAWGQRKKLLSRLQELGFEVGSGVMVGLPGQSLGDLAQDVEMFAQLDLDMIGIGPFIPHPETPLGARSQQQAGDSSTASEQAHPNELTTCKMVALARLVCPNANIPSTTALSTINPGRGQILGLQRGANVVMPNLTPLKYRREYKIYPDKAGSQKSPSESDVVARERLHSLGRPVAVGRGDSPNVSARRKQSGRPQHENQRSE